MGDRPGGKEQERALSERSNMPRHATSESNARQELAFLEDPGKISPSRTNQKGLLDYLPSKRPVEVEGSAAREGNGGSGQAEKVRDRLEANGRGATPGGEGERTSFDAEAGKKSSEPACVQSDRLDSVPFSPSRQRLFEGEWAIQETDRVASTKPGHGGGAHFPEVTCHQASHGELAADKAGEEKPSVHVEGQEGRKASVPSADWKRETVEELRVRRNEEDKVLGEASATRSVRTDLQRDSQLSRTEPKFAKSHWDYVLAEMAWFATDMEGERRWKRESSAFFASQAAALKGKPQHPREELNRLHTRIASRLSADVSTFWRKMWALAKTSEGDVHKCVWRLDWAKENVKWMTSTSDPRHCRLNGTAKRAIERWAVQTLSKYLKDVDKTEEGWAWEGEHVDEGDGSTTPEQSESTHSIALCYKCPPEELRRVYDTIVEEEKKRFSDYQQRYKEWEEYETNRQKAVEEANRVAAEERQQERLQWMEALYTEGEIFRRREESAQQRKRWQEKGKGATSEGEWLSRRGSRHQALDEDEDLAFDAERAGQMSRKRSRRAPKGLSDENDNSSMEEEQVLPSRKRARSRPQEPEPGQQQNQARKKAPSQLPHKAQAVRAFDNPGRFQPWENCLLYAAVKDYGQNWYLIADMLAASAPFRGVNRRAEACRRQYAALERTDPDEHTKTLMKEMEAKGPKAMVSRCLPVEDSQLPHYQSRLSKAFERNVYRKERGRKAGMNDIFHRRRPHQSWETSRKGVPIDLDKIIQLESSSEAPGSSSSHHDFSSTQMASFGAPPPSTAPLAGRAVSGVAGTHTSSRQMMDPSRSQPTSLAAGMPALNEQQSAQMLPQSQIGGQQASMASFPPGRTSQSLPPAAFVHGGQQAPQPLPQHQQQLMQQRRLPHQQPQPPLSTPQQAPPGGQQFPQNQPPPQGHHLRGFYPQQRPSPK